MDNYTGEKFWFLHYEVTDDKILVYSSGVEVPDELILDQKNIQILEQYLLEQHQNFKENTYGKLRSQRKFSIVSFCNWGCGSVLMIATHSIAFLPLEVFMLLQRGIEIYQVQKKIHRFELTDYCLEHALEIRELKEDSKPIALSENAERVFSQDGGFTLNHAHLYTTEDLKQLKKTLKFSNKLSLDPKAEVNQHGQLL